VLAVKYCSILLNSLSLSLSLSLGIEPPKPSRTRVVLRSGERKNLPAPPSFGSGVNSPAFILSIVGRARRIVSVLIQRKDRGAYITTDLSHPLLLAIDPASQKESPR
jgi:hypothetical protein